ncbi:MULTISPECIES: TrkA C-terminal domain-containing protein, partial [Duncaniella]|uniref:TrkA C-terminal domain-containing protein n=1 Tax=Duncaniella TaxID=2518495 RepID=UPI0025736A0B
MLDQKEMNESSLTSDPAYIIANRPVAFRAYSVTSDFFDSPQSVAQIESHLHSQGRRLFIERVRSGHNIIEPTPETRITKGDEIVLSGRREYIIEDESWIGPEVNDAELLDFPAEQIPVMITRKTVAGLTVDELRSQTYMYGVSIKSIDRGGVAIPVLAKTKLMAGDTLTLVGLASEVNTA